MSYTNDKRDEALKKIENLVHLDDGDTWDDPYSLLECIQMIVEDAK